MNQHSIELVIDKKDKFKSKLFSKKLEELFQASFEDAYTLNNAAYLYKCSFCRKLLLPQVENDVKCLLHRTTLNRYGEFKYKHLRDPNWNVPDYLLSLKGQENTWRMVYWRIWSEINFLKCATCDAVFPLCEFMQCLTHPDKDTRAPIDSVYSCCQQQRRHFEPIKTVSGCQFEEHKIDMTYPGNALNKIEIILNELEVMKNLVCFQRDVKKSDIQNSSYDITSMINLMRNESNVPNTHNIERKKSANLKANTVRKESFYRQFTRKKFSDDEDSDSDEPGIVRISIQTKNISNNSRNSSRTWNTDLPFRLNQDMQREKDLKRMMKIIDNLQLDDKISDNSTIKSDTSCGTFFQLEQKRRKEISNNSTSNSQVNIMNNKKGRLTDR